jgi:hypothetical protein
MDFVLLGVALFVVSFLPILHWQRQDAEFFARTGIPQRVWKNLFTFVLPFAGVYWWVTVARDRISNRRSGATA